MSGGHRVGGAGRGVSPAEARSLRSVAVRAGELALLALIVTPLALVLTGLIVVALGWLFF